MQRTLDAYINIVKYKELIQVERSQLSSLRKQYNAIGERAAHGYGTVTDMSGLRQLGYIVLN